jgi:hypothetical protein
MMMMMMCSIVTPVSQRGERGRGGRLGIDEPPVRVHYGQELGQVAAHRRLLDQ